MGIEEAPVEEAPVEEAPIEEAPVVEAAPVEEAPVVEAAPIETDTRTALILDPGLGAPAAVDEEVPSLAPAEPEAPAVVEKTIAPAEEEAAPAPASYGAPSYYAPPSFYGASYYQPYYPRYQPYPSYGGYHGVSVEPLKGDPEAAAEAPADAPVELEAPAPISDLGLRSEEVPSLDLRTVADE